MRFLLTVGLVLLPSLVSAASIPSPPPTEAMPVKETIHGVEMVDPYRWLEGSAAPEIEGADADLDQRVSTWTDEQNAYTRTVLDDLPGRGELEARLEALLEVGRVSRPTVRQNRYFFWERQGDQPQWTVKVQEGVDGEARMLLDVNTLDPDGLTALGWFTPDPSGELAAFGIYQAGDENFVLHVLEVDTGTWLAEEIPGKVRGVSWLPDSSGFLYHRLEDLDNPYSTQIKLHRLGTHHRQDTLVFEQYKEGPLATTWGPGAGISRDGRWMVLMYWTGTDSNDLWVIDFDRWRRTGELEKKVVVEGAKATSFGQIVGDTLFLTTTVDAPNGRVVAVDLYRPGQEHWKEILPEREDAVLTGVAVARGVLAPHYLKDAYTRIELTDYEGRSLGELELPGIGSASLSAFEDRTEAFLSFSSFNEPQTLYRLDLASGERSRWAKPDVPVDPSLIEVHQVRYPSKDGTEVTMFLVHKKGLEKNGKVPTLISGYGGFGISLTPRFSSTIMPWLEAGGLYAVPNLRGGGEYGDDWHKAGMLEHKQNVFDDFIAAAEYLIAEGYTDSKHLGIRGGSNGGLLTGAALVQRPDLYSAVISAVPLLDMLRYQHFLMARYWVPEYGDPENQDHFGFLSAYSPYQNIRPDTAYPAVFLTAGENDARVHPLHARKMAARLRDATASDPAEDPILLWVDRSAGHGAGKPLDLQVQDAADMLIFVMWQLGMLPG